MKKVEKRNVVVAVIMVAIMMVVFFGTTPMAMTAHAEGTLSGNTEGNMSGSGVRSTIVTSQGKTISSNIHTVNASGIITGACMISPRSSLNTALGITPAQVASGMQGVLRVYDSACGPNAQASLQHQATLVGGTIISYVALMMDVELNGQAVPVYNSAAPVNICLGIPYSLVAADRDFAVIALQPDGRMFVLGDIDDTPDVIAFPTQIFNTYAIICGPKGQFDQYKIYY